MQWERYWDALFKYRLPDELFSALEAIAEAEHRTMLEQITTFLETAVAQWQAQHSPR